MARGYSTHMTTIFILVNNCSHVMVASVLLAGAVIRWALSGQEGGRTRLALAFAVGRAGAEDRGTLGALPKDWAKPGHSLHTRGHAAATVKAWAAYQAPYAPVLADSAAS